MSQATAEMKVPGGKLLRVKVDAVDGRITSVAITGDFFVHPEESLKMVERALVGAPLNEDSITKLAQKAIEVNSILVVGFGASDLGKTVMLTTKPKVIG